MEIQAKKWLAELTDIQAKQIRFVSQGAGANAEGATAPLANYKNHARYSPVTRDYVPFKRCDCDNEKFEVRVLGLLTSNYDYLHDIAAFGRRYVDERKEKCKDLFRLLPPSPFPFPPTSRPFPLLLPTCLS